MAIGFVGIILEHSFVDIAKYCPEHFMENTPLEICRHYMRPYPLSCAMRVASTWLWYGHNNHGVRKHDHGHVSAQAALVDATAPKSNFAFVTHYRHYHDAPDGWFR
eukprot:CAMPEP_0168447034 /NCGR_PEP_ID=MMETSP0228-20121227/46384_1 /TAXON_ID=133427 /ORGANISM="Protoceratium reticulatum, Strain CCCM 535 (=CCMP 1889)" /LENGTH=105 /DNA_ID=CAMNT_0008461551 /DNA_START=91 /DNA_END=404 /DNA_ORIENTATION=+